MNGTAIIRDNVIEYENEIISFESLYTNEFYEYSNRIANKYNFGTVIDNVMFLYFIRPMLTFVFFFKENKIENIKIEKVNGWYKQIIISAMLYIDIPYNIKEISLTKINGILNRLIILLSAFYLMLVSLLVRYDPDEKENEYDLWVIRTNADRQKLYNRDNTLILEETKIGRGSLYQSIILKCRLKNILKSYKRANLEYCRIITVLDKARLSRLKLLILPYFAKRLTHIFYWGYSLESVIKNGMDGISIVSGNYCDAYAEVERRVSKKYKKTLIILPHGLEDGFILPNGFTGDLFYSMTKYAAEYLNHLYQTNKFIYDEAVISNMLKKDIIEQSKRIVFFTDGTGSRFDIDLIMHLSKFLKQYKQKLYVKLHPYERKEKYRNIKNIDYINQINEALCGNICISRGSTILVEAVYNNSVSIQVLIGDDRLKCTNMIPSLEDKRIFHIFNYNDLEILILNILKNGKEER